MKFDSSGSIDRSFGNDGLATAPGGAGKLLGLFRMSDGGYLLVNELEVAKFSAGGDLDSAFADGGHLDPGSFGDTAGNILSAAADGEHLILLERGDGEPVVTKFNGSGAREAGFGTGGLAAIPEMPWTSVTGGMAVGLDSGKKAVIAGRITVAEVPGYPYSSYGAVRLDENGHPDSGFGPAPGGTARIPADRCPPGGCPGRSQVQLQTGPEDSIRLLDQTSYPLTKAHCYNGVIASFAANGEPGAFDPQMIGDCRVRRVSGFLPDGDVILINQMLGGGYGRSSVPAGLEISRFSPGESRPADVAFGYSEPVWRGRVGLTPGAQQSLATAVDPASGEIVAVGSVMTPVCRHFCEYRQSMALARFDGETGTVVSSFGESGAVMVPDNACPYGDKSDSGAGGTAWKRCRVVPPRPSVKARSKKRKKRGAMLVVRASPGDSTFWMGPLTQVLRIHLPKALGALRPGLSGIRVRVRGGDGSKTKVKRNRRQLLIRTVRRWASCDSGSACTQGNSPIRFRLTVQLKSRKILRRSSRKRPLRLRGRMAFRPPSPKWYATNWKSYVAPVR